MCNRYALTKKQERIITQEFGSLDFYFMERFNIAPTQRAPLVLLENGRLISREMNWGFQPKWAKGPLTNAQLETLAPKPTFKAGLKWQAIYLHPPGNPVCRLCRMATWALREQRFRIER